MAERLSDAEFAVLTDALIAEAGKWRDLSKRMQHLVGRIGQLGIDLRAFLPVPESAFLAWRKYGELRQVMEDLTGQAVVEFRQTGDALDRARESYRATEDQVVVDLSKIYGPDPAHG